jgi:hypothetical protein
MPIEVFVKATDITARALRRVMAERVIGSFVPALPDRRLLCFFDDEDCLNIKEEAGKANRGLYAPVRKGNPLWAELPPDVLSHIGRGDVTEGSTFQVRPMPAFDHLVYLHGSTCVNEVGMAMTLAHELQHFVQHESALRLWAANTVAIHTLTHVLTKPEIESLRLRQCDIPIEQEARIVSKRIAQGLFREDVVRGYIDARIDDHVTDQDAADWECVRDLDASARYDLASETAAFFTKLKYYTRQLERSLHYLGRDDPDFVELDFGLLLFGSRV